MNNKRFISSCAVENIKNSFSATQALIERIVQISEACNLWEEGNIIENAIKNYQTTKDKAKGYLSPKQITPFDNAVSEIIGNAEDYGIKNDRTIFYRE